LTFAPNREHAALREVVADFLAAHASEARVRVAMETEAGFDAVTWRRVGAELELCGLAVPAAYGGSGYSFAEVCVVLEEMGSSLACLPYFSSVVLAHTLLQALGPSRCLEHWLPLLANGSKRAAVALAETSGRWDEPGVQARAVPDAQAWRVTGTKMFVLDGHTADLLLVAARTGAGLSVFAVESDAPGLTRTLLPTMDRTRKQARLVLADTPATLVGPEGGAWPALSTMLDLAAVGLAAEQVGGGRRCLDMAVGYAGQRVQFDRVIGSFQAVKHICADMLIDLECARSALLMGVRAATEAPDELPVSASLAKSYCSDAYLNIAKSNIQVHGGIGFTWEHPAHLYFKRAMTSQILFGDVSYHRGLLADRIAI
jgi:alkylation response protein AidB-like acyl-CoA dehydrogenase